MSTRGRKLRAATRPAVTGASAMLDPYSDDAILAGIQDGSLDAYMVLMRAYDFLGGRLPDPRKPRALCGPGTGTLQ